QRRRRRPGERRRVAADLDLVCVPGLQLHGGRERVHRRGGGVPQDLGAVERQDGRVVAAARVGDREHVGTGLRGGEGAGVAAAERGRRVRRRERVGRGGRLRRVRGGERGRRDGR